MQAPRPRAAANRRSTSSRNSSPQADQDRAEDWAGNHGEKVWFSDIDADDACTYDGARGKSCMNSRCIALASSITLLTGCGGGFGPSPASPPVLPGSLLESAAKAKQLVYWTLYGGRSFPEVQHALVPLTAKSKARDIGGSTKNDLNYTSGMTVDSKGKLWILSFGHYGGNPEP